MLDLEPYFDTAFAAPEGIKRLRELILSLAMQGKLVEQDPNDPPASELLKEIEAEKQRLVKEGKIKAPKPLPTIAPEDVLYALPEGWEWASLAQVALINPRNLAPDDTEVSFVPMTLIGTSMEGTHEQETRLWKEVKQGFTHFAEGDIGVAKITPCFENSKACIFNNLLNGIGAGTTELHIVRPVTESLVPRFVLAYLKAPQFLQLGQTKMTGTAGQKRLPKDFVELNPFPLPPLPEQQRIVAKIDQLMARCDALEALRQQQSQTQLTVQSAALQGLLQASAAEDFARAWAFIRERFGHLYNVPATVQELRKAILQLAVMGKLVPQDPHDPPASELLKDIEAEKQRLVKEKKIKAQKPLPAITAEEIPFALPESWEWVRFGHLVELLNGYAFKSEWFKNDGVRLLRNINIGHGSINWEEVVHIDDQKANEFKKFSLSCNDIVLTLDRPIINTGLKYAVVKKDDLPCLLLQRVAKFEIPLDYIQAKVVTFWLESPYFMNSIDPGRSKGVPHISTNQIANLLFPLMPFSEQTRLSKKVDQLMALCDRLEHSIEAQESKQAALLNALMSEI